MASSAYNPTMLYDPGDHQTSALPAPLQTNVNPPQPQWSLSNNPIFAPYPVSLRQVPAETSTSSQGNTQRIFDTNMPVIGGLDMNQTGNQGMRRDMKEDTPPAKKKTRNRKPASCAPCRKKKLRCDRLVPCSACQQRGEAHLCSWENAVPLYLARDMNDMAELRAQVDRLQALVDVLANPNNGGNLNLPEAQQRVLDDNRALSNASQQEEVDLKANDLCEALSHLAISQIMRIDEPTGEKLKETQIFDEARTFCAALPQAYGLSTTIPSSGSNQTAPGADTAASSLARLSYASETATVKDALKCMPLLEQANSALSYYFSYVDWYLHACHTPTFHFQMQRLRETAEKNPDAVDPFFLAVYLSLCGVGLAMMPSSRARRDGFPVDKDKLANTWLEGAMIALTAGKFLDTPTLDAIRALIIINAYFVFMATGESVNGGISILTMAVQLAVQLGLNRDPDRMDKKFTYLEAEDRRRIFWTLFHLLTLSSSSLGRTWSNFDMEAIDVKLPDDMNDEDFSKKEFKDAEQTVKKTSKKETVMTSLLIRIRIAQVAVKISKRAFGIKGVTYSEIFQLDSQIREIEDNLPPFYLLKFDREDYWNIIPPSDHVTASEMRTYMIWIGLAQEYIRIHRPYLILGYHNAEYAYSRSQCLKYSKIILAISRMPAMKQKWGGLTYKVISGAIILGIELLQNPEAPDAKLLRSNLSLAKQQLEFFADVSSLARRGSKVLQFLEEKDNTRRNSAAPPSSKKSRTSTNHPKSALEQALNSVPSAEDDNPFLTHKPASQRADSAVPQSQPRVSRPSIHTHALSDGGSSTQSRSQLSSPTAGNIPEGFSTEFSFQFGPQLNTSASRSTTSPTDITGRHPINGHTMYPPAYPNQVSPASSIISGGTGYPTAGNLPGLDTSIPTTDGSLFAPISSLLEPPLYPTVPTTDANTFQPIPTPDANIYLSPDLWKNLDDFTDPGNMTADWNAMFEGMNREMGYVNESQT